MNDTIMDVINWANSRIVFDWVLLLQVTTPQRELAPIMDFINWALEEEIVLAMQLVHQQVKKLMSF